MIMKRAETVEHPAHYNSNPSGVECITVARHFGFNLGNVLKYIWRSDHKGAALEDLRKARFFLQDEIALREATAPPAEGDFALRIGPDPADNPHGIGPRDPSRHGDWIQATRGRRFWPLDVRPGDLDIDDLALVLSREPRWCGLTRMDMPAYCTAQHSVLVSLHCEPEDSLWGLLHEWDEFIFHDLPGPLKHSPEMAGYRAAQRKLMAAACEQFGLPLEMPASVKRADTMLLATEARDLFDQLDPEWEERFVKGTPKLSGRIVPWTATKARRAFLARYRELIKQRAA